MNSKKKHKIRILLTDDHPFLREGIRKYLSAQDGIEVVAEASNGEEAIQATKKLRPDILVLDIKMPGMDGLAVAKKLRKAAPATKIIIFSMYDNREYVLDAIRSGAKGYVIKDAPVQELLAAIEAVNGGKTFFSARVTKMVMSDYIKHADLLIKGISGGKLSRREEEVLSLIANGYTNKETGRCFGVSSRTIETHRAHIRDKLGLDRTADLVKYAIANGMSLKT